MTHILMIVGFVIIFGVAGRFDCDVVQGVTSPDMMKWIISGVLLMIPELIWFSCMVRNAKKG